jgi:hypothetical protein
MTENAVPAVGFAPALTEVIASFVGRAALIVKALLVAPVSPVADAVSVYPAAALLMLRSVKLATPETAFLVLVPLRTPPPGFVPMATVIEAVEDVTVLPELSCTTTVGGPAIKFPAVVVPG